jgi:hypothetical protein
MNKSIFFALTILLLASCRSTKVVEPTFSKAPKSDLLIESVKSAHFDFNSMSAKISGSYQDADQKFSFKGNVKIKKDSLIWVSISPGLGIELGRVLFDLDSMHFINRYEKTYQKRAYAELSEKIQSPVTYQRIQDLLIGNSLDEYQSRKYFSALIDQSFVLSSLSPRQTKKWNRSKKISARDAYTLSISPLNSKIETQEYRDFKQSRLLHATYDHFESFNEIPLAKSIVLKIDAEKKVSLKLNYSKVNLNTQIKTPFKVPDSYETIR